MLFNNLVHTGIFGGVSHVTFTSLFSAGSTHPAAKSAPIVVHTAAPVTCVMRIEMLPGCKCALSLLLYLSLFSL